MAFALYSPTPIRLSYESTTNMHYPLNGTPSNTPGTGMFGCSNPLVTSFTTPNLEER